MFSSKFLFSTMSVLCMLSSPLLALSVEDEEFPVRSSSAFPGSEQELAELFEDGSLCGKIFLQRAKIDLEKIKDSQLRQLAIQVCKLAFPDSQTYRADVLNLLVQKERTESELKGFIRSLKEESHENLTLPFAFRMEKYQDLLAYLPPSGECPGQIWAMAFEKWPEGARYFHKNCIYGGAICRAVPPSDHN